MIDYSLPESVTVDGREYTIRWDFRAALDIICALQDPELTDRDKAVVALRIFYPEKIPPDTDEAIKACFRFLDGGEERTEKRKSPRLMDWEQDFRWIIAPINKAAGRDVRTGPLHWWSFLGYYYEIGDCTFAHIVRIRDMQARGKPLDKADKEWARRNADMVRLKTKTTKQEDDLLAVWLGGGAKNAD